MRGSKYELKFDHKGQAINESEVRDVLKKEGAQEEQKMDSWDNKCLYNLKNDGRFKNLKKVVEA